jgi:hypothetical protein
MLVCILVMPILILLQVTYLRIVPYQRPARISIEGRTPQEKSQVR